MHITILDVVMKVADERVDDDRPSAVSSQSVISSSGMIEEIKIIIEK
jgi:hypothetical protein